MKKDTSLYLIALDGETVFSESKEDREIRRYNDYNYLASIFGAVGIVMWFIGLWFLVLPFGVLSIFYMMHARKHGVKSGWSLLFSISSCTIGVLCVFACIILFMY